MSTPSRLQFHHGGHSPPVPSVSPSPVGGENTGRHAYPKGGYVPGMFNHVGSPDEFAGVLGVPTSSLALVVPLDSQCRHSGCPHTAILSNCGYCPIHRRAWYPLAQDWGSDHHGPEFLPLSSGRKKTRCCDCDQQSCFKAGYFPNQEAIYIPASGHDVVLSTPGLLSAATRKKLKESKSKKKLFLYPWHFFPEHRTRRADGSWELLFHKRVHRQYHDLERNVYLFPPPATL